MHRVKLLDSTWTVLKSTVWCGFWTRLEKVLWWGFSKGLALIRFNLESFSLLRGKSLHVAWVLVIMGVPMQQKGPEHYPNPSPDITKDLCCLHPNAQVDFGGHLFTNHTAGPATIITFPHRACPVRHSNPAYISATGTSFIGYYLLPFLSPQVN